MESRNCSGDSSGGNEDAAQQMGGDAAVAEYIVDGSGGEAGSNNADESNDGNNNANDNSRETDVDGDNSVNSDTGDDASVSSDDESYDDFVEFDDEVLEELKGNRGITPNSVEIWNNPLENIDWGKEINALSKNTRLKSLEIRYWQNSEEEEEVISSERERRYAERNAKNFYRAVAGFNALKYLNIRGCVLHGLDMGEIFSILTPSFQNCNLRELLISHITLDSITMEVLKSALLSNCNLDSFGLNWCEGMNKEVMETIVDILVSNPNIETLRFEDYDMVEEAVVLGKALCSTVTSVKTLSLRSDADMEGRRGSITTRGVYALSKSLSSSNTSLEKLDLGNNQIIGMEGGITLAESLSNNIVLKELDISWAVSPGFEGFIMSQHGWNLFFNGLKSCALQKLSLEGNNIGDEDIETMVDALNTMNSLRDLDLSSTIITPSGWVKFFKLMKQSGSVFERLTHLDIMARNNELSLDKEVLNAFVNALANSSLQKCEMFTIGGFDGYDQEGAWDALSNALCNISSIESICNSNHTLVGDVGTMYSFLSFLGDEGTTEYTRSISPLLKLNKGTDKADVIRQKIFRYYLSEEGNLQST